MIDSLGWIPGRARARPGEGEHHGEGQRPPYFADGLQRWPGMLPGGQVGGGKTAGKHGISDIMIYNILICYEVFVCDQHFISYIVFYKHFKLTPLYNTRLSKCFLIYHIYIFLYS